MENLQTLLEGVKICNMILTICGKLEIPKTKLPKEIQQNTNTTPNTTMTKLVQLLRKNTQKTLSISDMNLENKLL